ncbi:MAG TPA: hypothetical protein VFA09_12935 [Ktedonobacteraceae bacterium]|nr:hypothetical protein [Ktedonobacteraceae bacterium]
MPGRESQGNDSWDRFSSGPLAATNGTGKQRAIPRRPSNMPRVDRPPRTPRVGRPQRETPRPKRGRRLLVLLLVFVICGVLAAIIGAAAVFYFTSIGVSSGAASTASDFLNSLATQDYNQAYKDLDATITLQIAPDDFVAQAKQEDTCYGAVTTYSEVNGSATTSPDNLTQSFTYTVTRSKGKSYQLHLTLHKDNYGNWYITYYGGINGGGNNLAPGLPTCNS